MQIIEAARGNITSRHGEDIGRPWPHVGIDIGHGSGTGDDIAVLAPADGVIRVAGYDGSYGNRIVIDHADGTWSLLAHLADDAFRTSGAVSQRERIATMGDTGTEFVHLHQEYHLSDGAALDPLDYLTPTPTEGISMPTLISAPQGTIAFVSETHGYSYTDPNDFSLAANRWAYGEITGLTEDVVKTLVAEANYRGDLLAGKIADLVKG